MYYCYILYSIKLDKYYIGSTGDLQGRLQRHNYSNRGFISTGQPWKIVYFEEFGNKSEAIKRELKLKRLKSRSIIEGLIRKD